MTSRLASGLISIAALLLAGAGGVSAQNADIPRNIIIYVAGGAGSGMDFYSRILAHHMGRHIAGNPDMTVQVMPGAGGIRAADFLAHAAPKDGSVLATFPSGTLVEPLVGGRKTAVNTSEFQWIGAMSRDVSICIAGGQSGFKTLADAKERELVIAGTGAGSETDTIPLVLNDIFGAKFRVVSGYQGSPATLLAIERREVNGRCGISYSSLKALRPDWVPTKKINVLLQIGAEKSSELPDVPLASDIVPRPEDAELLNLLVGANSINRPYATAPGTPAARVSALRRAFDETMSDPEFSKEAERLGADIAPTSGEDVQKFIAKLYATPKPVVERARTLLGVKK